MGFYKEEGGIERGGIMSCMTGGGGGIDASACKEKPLVLQIQP